MEQKDRRPHIELLKSELEEAIGEEIKTPRQFEKLRELVYARTREYVSTTTLKRIWGYLNEPLKTREGTLTLLAQTLGFKSWDDFISLKNGSLQEHKLPSSPKFGRSITVATDLVAGDRIRLTWYPGRVCVVRYLGDMKFEVEESEKTRLKPGDTFCCHLILAGNPLYLSNLRHGNSPATAYMCGRIHGGIQFEKL